MEKDHDPESRINSQRFPYLPLMWHQGHVDEQIASHKYTGLGTTVEPFVVEWLENDPRNPMLFSDALKWLWTMLGALSTFIVAFTTSAYTAAPNEVLEEFHVSHEIFALGLSFFVLGLALGPLIWAPLSELYGRQIIFTVTFAALTAFDIGCAVAPNMATLIVLRFFAAAVGSSSFTNAGGVVADIWPVKQRGMGLLAFSAAPFFGPVLGPVCSGFLGESKGWRWVAGLQTILAGVIWIMMTFVVPETYAPVLLRRRAQRLSKMTGKVYVSKFDVTKRKKTLFGMVKVALTRPWALLWFEPIVLLLSLYMALLYGILYMFFGAFPIVYQQHRGWNEGIGGLSFLGIAVGIGFGIAYMFPDNVRYKKLVAGGKLEPEMRLPPAMVGAVAIPAGMFWFAWTNGPKCHWLISIAAQIPFGFGFVLVYLSIQAYLVDAYTINAASVLACNVLLRSGIGAAFPLFTTYMYNELGVHWASTIPAFLALACVPLPFFFYKYGPRIRERCRFAKEAR